MERSVHNLWRGFSLHLSYNPSRHRNTENLSLHPGLTTVFYSKRASKRERKLSLFKAGDGEIFNVMLLIQPHLLVVFSQTKLSERQRSAGLTAPEDRLHLFYRPVVDFREKPTRLLKSGKITKPSETAGIQTAAL